MTIGQALRREIDQRAISQAVAAHEMGVSQQTVARWKNDQLLPKPENLPAVASFLKLSESRVKAMRAQAAPSIEDRVGQVEARLDELERLIDRALAPRARRGGGR